MSTGSKNPVKSRLLGFALILLPIVALVVVIIIAPRNYILISFIAATGTTIIWNGRRLMRGDQTANLKEMTEDPIVYFRAFAKEGLKHDRLVLRARSWIMSVSVTTNEALFAKKLRAIGPLVAVGKPGDKLSPLGALRSYVGEDWQSHVDNFLARAQLVILRAEPGGEGFLWEIRRVLETFDPGRLCACQGKIGPLEDHQVYNIASLKSS